MRYTIVLKHVNEYIDTHLITYKYTTNYFWHAHVRVKITVKQRLILYYVQHVPNVGVPQICY